jgi:hypothetical protein
MCCATNKTQTGEQMKLYKPVVMSGLCGCETMDMISRDNSRLLGVEILSLNPLIGTTRRDNMILGVNYSGKFKWHCEHIQRALERSRTSR